MDILFSCAPRQKRSCTSLESDEGPQAVFAASSKRILIGVSNVADMGDPEKHEAKNSLWEVAPAYHVFVMHGYEVDFVSPKGGAVPFSREVYEVDPPGMISYTIKYERFRDKASHTLTPDKVDPSHYAGYFIAGGAGPLFDVATDSKILQLRRGYTKAVGLSAAADTVPAALQM